jgi:hypothetical protein
MRAESAVFSQQMDQVRRTTARTHQGVVNFSNEGSRGMRKLENAAMNLTLGMVGLHGAAGKAAEGMLMLGVGGAALTAITIGLAGAGFLYEKLTEKTRKATEETDKFIEAQLKAARIRANPNAELLGGIGGARAREAELSKNVVDAMQRNVKIGFDPASGASFDDALKKLREVREAIAGAQGSIAEKGFDLIKNLSIQAATFGMSTEAAQRYALAMDGSLEPSVRKTATALLTHIERLRENKEMMEASAKAQAELTAKFNAFWDDIEAKANLAGPMVTKRIEDMVKAQQKAFGDRLGDRIDSGFALAQESTVRIERPEIFAKMERNAELMEETWKNSIQGIQEAFAVHVHQTVTFNAGFVDGASGEAWLKSKSGTIAGVVADAASSAPAFARHIVAQGMR